MYTDLMAEVDKMRRVPGIDFVDGATGRRARVAGTGLAVFEVIQVYRSVGENWDGLKAALHWWTDAQLRAALTYAETYPEEIYPRIEADEALCPEDVWEKYPFTNPHPLVPLYLDEMFAPLVAALLCAQGIDCLSAIELGNVSTADEVHLMFAAREGRCLVTQDLSDFIELTAAFMERSEPHGGILFVPTSIRTHDFGRLVAALAHFARQHPEGLSPYSLLWLPRAPT